MEAGYGQFVYLDDNNNFEDESTMTANIVTKNSNVFKTNLYLKNNFNGSILIMFLQYVCNLVEYFYKK